MEQNAVFDFTKFKQVKELHEATQANKLLKDGWVLLYAGVITGAFGDCSKLYILGTTVEEDTQEDDFYSKIVR